MLPLPNKSAQKLSYAVAMLCKHAKAGQNGCFWHKFARIEPQEPKTQLRDNGVW